MAPHSSPPLTDRPQNAPPLTVSRPELLINGSDAEFRRLIHATFAFLARHEALRAGFGSRIGLGGVEYSILVAIGHLSRGPSQVVVNQLASHLFLSGAFVTTVTTKLAKMGLITKQPDPGDRRRVLLNLTDKAWELLGDLAPVQRQVNDVEFAPLQKGDLMQLVTLLEQLIQSSESALKLQEFLNSSPA